MSRSELVRRLRGEGVEHASYTGVWYAVLVGAIDRPPKDAFGNYIFDEHHLEQARVYFATPRKRGRRPVNQSSS